MRSRLDSTIYLLYTRSTFFGTDCISTAIWLGLLVHTAPHRSVFILLSLIKSVLVSLLWWWKFLFLFCCVIARTKHEHTLTLSNVKDFTMEVLQKYSHGSECVWGKICTFFSSSFIFIFVNVVSQGICRTQMNRGLMSVRNGDLRRQKRKKLRNTTSYQVVFHQTGVQPPISVFFGSDHTTRCGWYSIWCHRHPQGAHKA